HAKARSLKFDGTPPAHSGKPSVRKRESSVAVRPQANGSLIYDDACLVSDRHRYIHGIQGGIRNGDACDECGVVEQQHKVTIELAHNWDHGFLIRPAENMLLENCHAADGVAG